MAEISNRLIKRQQVPFVQVSLDIVNDDRVSWKAKGLMLYLLAQRDDWSFFEKEIATHSSDGKDSVRTGLEELEKCGYLIRIWIRDNKGKYLGREWNIYQTPLSLDAYKKEKETLESEAYKARHALDLPDSGKSDIGFPEIGFSDTGSSDTGSSDIGKPATNNNNNNNNNNNHINLNNINNNNVVADISLDLINNIFVSLQLGTLSLNKKSAAVLNILLGLDYDTLMLLATRMSILQTDSDNYFKSFNSSLSAIIANPDLVYNIINGEIHNRPKDKKAQPKNDYDIYVPPDSR